MEFSKEELVILIALVGKSTNIKKIKKVKKVLYIEKEDIKNTVEKLRSTESSECISFNLYKTLRKEYDKLR